MVTEARLLRREEAVDPSHPPLLTGDWRGGGLLRRKGVAHRLAEVGTEDDGVRGVGEGEALPGVVREGVRVEGEEGKGEG